MTQDDINLVDSHIDQRIQAERERNEGHFMTVENCQKEMNRNDIKIDEMYKNFDAVKSDLTEIRIKSTKSDTKLSILLAILSPIGITLLGVIAEYLFR